MGSIFRNFSKKKCFFMPLLSQSVTLSDFQSQSVTVAQIKKIQKTKSIYFRILLLGGPSPPSQLVPNPFNWSPNTVFFTDISVSGAQIKKIRKQSPFIFEFCFW